MSPVDVDPGLTRRTSPTEIPFFLRIPANVSPKTIGGSWNAILTGAVCLFRTLPRAVIWFELGERATQKEERSFLPVLEEVLFHYQLLEAEEYW